MSSSEFSGKSVDEAIFNGLIHMGKTIDEVEIEIVQQGSKGFLGIGKSTIVRLTERDMSEAVAHKTAAAQAAPQKPKSAPRAQVSAQKPNKPQEVRKPGQAVKNSGERQAPPDDFTPVIADHEAARFLDGIISRMNMKASIAVVEETDEALMIDLSGPQMGKLIGRRGETLDALQYLCSLYVNRGKGDNYKRVTLDTENYRDKRQSALVALANKTAARALKIGRRVALEPMNPYERRILHATLQDREGIVTYSQGEEPNRKVIIDLKKD